LGVNDRIFNVIVPKEKKVKIKNGRRTEVEEKIYPGYVLVEMVMSPDTWYIVRNTPRVTGFVGADSTTPSPLSKEEVEMLMMKMRGDETGFKVDFHVGELVRIVDGPFKDSDGKIAEIDESKGRVKGACPDIRKRHSR
jgi:transcriptional antiterminator NusG